MAVAIPTTSQAEMTISISDVSIVNDIRRLLRRVSGIEAIKVKRAKAVSMRKQELAVKDSFVRGMNEALDAEKNGTELESLDNLISELETAI